MKNALYDDEYKRSTWFCVGLFFFNQLTGNNAIVFYSTTILELMDADGNFALTPKMGTCIIGIFTFVGAFSSAIPLKFFGRKTLLLAG
jgi:hypothetical protein